MAGMSPQSLRTKVFLDKSVTVDGTGSNTENNVITLTFSEDDTYNLSFVFDDKPNSVAEPSKASNLISMLPSLVVTQPRL